MEFHVHIAKRVPDNFGTGRQLYAVLRYSVPCKAHQISEVAQNAEGKGFAIEDIHSTGTTCVYGYESE